MPQIQGRLPRVILPSRMHGKNQNGDYTNDSVIYRGRPYSIINAVDMMAIDAQREEAKPSWSRGLRTIGYYLTTSRTLPTN